MIKEILLYFYRRQRLLLTIMIVATASILLATLLPTESFAKTRFLEYDKIGHALIFGCWTYLFGLVRLSYTRDVPSYWGIELLTGFGFGLSIEMLQYALPINRSSSLFDMLANVIGIVLAVYFLRQTYQHLEKEVV